MRKIVAAVLAAAAVAACAPRKTEQAAPDYDATRARAERSQQQLDQQSQGR